MDDYKHVELLIRSIFLPRTLFILGAGASFGETPMGSDLRTNIERSWLSTGLFPAGSQPETNLFRSMEIGSSYSENELEKAFLRTMPPDSLKLLVYMHLIPQTSPMLPRSYRLFLYCQLPVLIMNMNVDGLAFCLKKKGIHIVDAHGTGDPELLLSEENRSIVSDAVEYGIALPIVNDIWLPEPEPHWITSTRRYGKLITFFEYAQRVVIIGYSFGRHESRIDDLETFLFVTELVHFYSLPVFIVSPNPWMQCDAISVAARSNKILGCPIYWDTFSSALFNTAVFFNCPVASLVKYYPAIMQQYHYLCVKHRRF